MDNKLINILNKRSMSFSDENIRIIMDEEFEKEVDEMDTDLIDACLDALGTPFGNINNNYWEEFEKAGKKVKRIRISKIILIAAIVAIIMSISISVSAKFLNVNASDKIVHYQGDHFDVDLNNSDDEFSTKAKNNLQSILEKEGFASAALPKAFYENDYTVTKSDKYIGNDCPYLSIDIKNKSNDIKGYINIIDWNGYETAFDTPSQLHTNYAEYLEQVDVNDITVLVYGGNEYSISYRIESIEYNIQLENCDFETAKLIAMTL